MAEYESQRIDRSSVSELIELINSIAGLGEKENIRTATADLSSLLAMGTTVDTAQEAEVYLNLTNSALNDAPPGFEDVFKLSHLDAMERKKLISSAGNLEKNLTDFNKRWLNLSPESVGNLNSYDVEALQKEFNDIYDTFSNIRIKFGKGPLQETGLIPTSVANNMELTASSFDGAIGDLLITDKITPDDWEIISTRPQDLDTVRAARIRQFTTTYEKNTELYNRIVINPNLKSDITMKVDTNNQEAVAELLEPLLRDPVTQELEAGVLEEATNMIFNQKAFGVDKVIDDLKNTTLNNIEFSGKQIKFWSGKTYNELQTGVEETDEFKQKRIFSSISGGIPSFIPEEFVKDGKFTDHLGVSHDVKKLKSGKYELTSLALTEVKKGTLDNPTDNSLLAAKSLPDLAWFLWNNSPETMKGININDKAAKLLEEKGLDVYGGVYGYTGNDYVRANNFIRDLKLIDKTLRDRKATTISYRDINGKTIKVYQGGIWTGANSEETIKLLTMIARDATAIIINGKHYPTPSNVKHRTMFGELEEKLTK